MPELGQWYLDDLRKRLGYLLENLSYSAATADLRTAMTMLQECQVIVQQLHLAEQNDRYDTQTKG